MKVCLSLAGIICIALLSCRSAVSTDNRHEKSVGILVDSSVEEIPVSADDWNKCRFFNDSLMVAQDNELFDAYVFFKPILQPNSVEANVDGVQSCLDGVEAGLDSLSRLVDFAVLTELEANDARCRSFLRPVGGFARIRTTKKNIWTISITNPDYVVLLVGTSICRLKGKARLW